MAASDEFLDLETQVMLAVSRTIQKIQKITNERKSISQGKSSVNLENSSEKSSIEENTSKLTDTDSSEYTLSLVKTENGIQKCSSDPSLGRVTYCAQSESAGTSPASQSTQSTGGRPGSSKIPLHTDFRASTQSLGRSHSVTFLLDPSKTGEKWSSADSILQDIQYLKSFNHRVNPAVSSDTKKTGRYSMVDRNLRALDETDHVITDLWNISSEKVNLALAGHMNSCQEEDTEIDCSNLSSSSKLIDYKDALVPVEGKKGESDNSDSGNDTDDLIEDARNFVRIGQSKLVTLDDWEDIDYRRKQRRKKRKEELKSSAEQTEESEIGPGVRGRDVPNLPRSIKEMNVGWPVKLFSTLRSAVLLGVIRFLGILEEREVVGVELQERRGDSDGTYRETRYFTCSPGFGLFVPVKHVILTWKP